MQRPRPHGRLLLRLLLLLLLLLLWLYLPASIMLPLVLTGPPHALPHLGAPGVLKYGV